MKGKFFLLILIEFVFFVAVMYCLIVNYKTDTACQFTATMNGMYVSVKTSTIIFIMWLAGVFSGFVYAISLSNRYRDQIEFYARKTEKLSQQNEIDSDDKEALQRKIASLEIALDKALKNKE